jgi:hypothetical protein
MRPNTTVAAGMLGLLALLAPAASGAIPANTWVAVPLPLSSATHGSACDDGLCKHLRLTYNTLDGRIYILGGDHNNGDGFPQSGSNEMWSYSARTYDWRIETPYCLPAGQLQPANPDEVGFAFDSRRNQFWMYPGYMNVSSVNCPSTAVSEKPMVYDVPTRTWRDPQLPWDAPLVRFSQYDAVRDRTISFEYDGSRYVEHNLATNVVRRVSTVVPPGEDGGGAFIGDQWTAVDPNGRKLYVIGIIGTGKLYRFDLDTDEFRFMANTPIPYSTWEDWVYWSAATQSLLWVWMPLPDPNTEVTGQARVFAWHASTNLWDEIPITPPVDLQGNPVVDSRGQPIQVKGRQGVFDPVENVMMILGVSGSDPVPYLFLYRYASGPPDTVPPSAPADLRPR